MNKSTKDTIYVDIDDEITSIIDKIESSNSKIIALILPKRATVLQSIVNMRLLKRASDDSGKRTVLITSEQGLLPLAGVAGVYVAKNLQSKPEIPQIPEDSLVKDELIEADEIDPKTDEIDKSKSVGELSGDVDDVFESDVTSLDEVSGEDAKPSKDKSKANSKSKGKKVPNFNLFRKRIIFIVLGVISIGALSYYAFFVAPRAAVTIKTETSTINRTIEFTASPTARSTNVERSILPSKEVEFKKSDTQKAPATGQKDLGAKATGKVTLSISCGAVSGSPPSIPAGTGVSNNNLTFITNSTVSLTTPSFNGGCKFISNVNVTAQANGEQYNLPSDKTFTVAGFSNVSATNADAFSGGSSKIAKVISQQDIDTAKQRLADNSEEAKSQLIKEIEDAGYFAVPDTFTVKSENITSSPDLDSEASEVTVTADRTYVMSGIKKDELDQFIKNSVQDEINNRHLQIQDNGLANAVFRVGERQNNGNVSMMAQVQVVLGPNIDKEQIKKDILGKKRGDIQELIKQIDGVKSADVRFSPFWVNVVPNNQSKVTISVEEAK